MKQTATNNSRPSRTVTSSVQFSGQVIKCLHHRIAESDFLPFQIEASSSERVLFCPTDCSVLCKISKGGFSIIGMSELVFLANPRSVLFYGRKDHLTVTTVSWPANSTPLLSPLYTLANKPGQPETFTPNHRNSEISILSGVLDNFIADPSSAAEPMAFAAIQVLATSALRGFESNSYAVVRADVSEGLKSLSNQVKDRPEANWSLASAAEIAGYSPFHLSRVFRSEIGVGFPEYVDRCRLSAVLENYLTPKTDIGKLAIASGFGSVSAFRECLKAHLGLLPTDLKRILQN